MNEREQEIKILNSFLSTFEMDGVCGFWVDETSDILMVYMVINLEWLREIQTKPEFVAKRMRLFVSSEIEKFTGLKVQVGSTAKNC